METFQAQNWSKEENLEDQKVKKIEETSSGFVTIIILSTFLAYVVFGAVLLPLLNGEVC